MNIVWDEPKRLANLDKHGLDFADLNEIFFDNALVIPSHNKSKRWVAIGVSIRALSLLYSHDSVARESASSVCGPQIAAKGNFMPNARKKSGYSKKDLREVSNNPELTEADFAKARPFSEVFPNLSASIRKGRGPNKSPTKKLVSLRLSREVIDHFKLTGAGWQSRIDETLRKVVKRKVS